MSNNGIKIGKIKAKSECFLSTETNSVVTNETEKTISTSKLGCDQHLDQQQAQQEKQTQTLHTNNKPVSLNRLNGDSKTRLISTPQICVRSRSLELNGLPMWNTKIDYINLKKSEKGALWDLFWKSKYAIVYHKLKLLLNKHIYIKYVWLFDHLNFIQISLTTARFAKYPKTFWKVLWDEFYRLPTIIQNRIKPNRANTIVVRHRLAKK